MGCCGFQGTDREAEVVPAPTAASALVADHRARAETALSAATGGRAMCRTDHGPAAKAAEGRLIAVRDLQHALRRSPGDELATARALLDEWTAERNAAGGRGPDWIAYREGGVAELQSLVAELAALPAGPPPR